jgi:hypothetical protein
MSLAKPDQSLSEILGKRLDVVDGEQAQVDVLQSWHQGVGLEIKWRKDALFGLGTAFRSFGNGSQPIHPSVLSHFPGTNVRCKIVLSRSSYNGSGTLP